MSLISVQYILFVAAFLALYYGIGRLGREQWPVILAGNLVFYLLAGSWQTAFIIVAVAAVTWGGSQLMERIATEGKQLVKSIPRKDREGRKAARAQIQTRKRRILWATLAIALCGILGYFKYWNVILYNFGFAPSTTSLGIVLPLGISFYTFQSVMYVIDVYNGKYAAEASFVRYLTFVSYFPQMIQGPINRFDELSPQIYARHEADGATIERGLWRVAYGVFKKIVIANVLAGKVSTIFGNVTPAIPGSVVVLGIITYSIQEYADFSAGIDIVTGVSDMLGIRMSQNFRQPYLSVSLADFWRRWHMSLGVFMKDYVFYPIALTKPFQSLGKWGQKRLGKHLGRTLPACLANIVVFLVVGLWHGAEWHFLIWGLFNGLVIAAADLLAPVFERTNKLLHIDPEGLPHRIFAIVRTFLLVCLIRYFDVMPNPMDSLICLRNTVTNFLPLPYRDCLAMMGVDGIEVFGLSRLAMLGFALVGVVSISYERGTDVRAKIMGWHPLAKMALVGVCSVLVILCFRYSLGGGNGFVYANF